MARWITAQNPGARSAQRGRPAPVTTMQPLAWAVTTGKLASPAAKLSRYPVPWPAGQFIGADGMGGSAHTALATGWRGGG